MIVLVIASALTIWKCTGGPPKAVTPMCQLATKVSRQPLHAAEEDEDASPDSTGRRADAIELISSQAGVAVPVLEVP